MSFTGRFTAALSAFRNPDGKFRAAPAKNEATPQRGEIAFADPRRLFPGLQPFVQYNPSLLVGMRGLAIFDEMLRDDQVKASLAFKKHACIATGWTVTTPEGLPEDWEPTRFTKWVLENLDPNEIGSATLDGDLYEMLSALSHGFSVTEKVWAPIESGEWEGCIGLHALKTRAPHSITFSQDVYGNIVPDGVVQVVNSTIPAGRMPRNKFVHFTYQSEYGNPYGRSDLEAAYAPWWGKTNSQKWLAMLLERLGIPPIFGLYNPARYLGGTLTDDLKKVLTNMQAATVGIIPRPDKDALEFWSPELAGQAVRVFIPSLEYFNSAISRAILMPNLLGMTSDGSQGSYARAKIHFNVFLLVVEQIRHDLETAINNQVVRPMLDLNFPSLPEYPTWRFLPLTDDLRIELISLWDKLVVDGVVSEQPQDEHQVRRMMQMPELSDKATKRDPSAASVNAQPGGPPQGVNGNGSPTPDDGAVAY